MRSVEAASRNSRPLFNFSRRREEDVNKNVLSLSSSSLFKPTPKAGAKTDNTDSKNQQKGVSSCENHDDEKLDCMCGYTGRHVYFEGFVWFLHARIGLLLNPDEKQRN